MGRLLNATIVVCGACYILYVAVYLGLDLKSVFAKPQHETYKVRLHLHSKPAAWVRILNTLVLSPVFVLLVGHVEGMGLVKKMQ